MRLARAAKRHRVENEESVNGHLRIHMPLPQPAID